MSMLFYYFFSPLSLNFCEGAYSFITKKIRCRQSIFHVYFLFLRQHIKNDLDFRLPRSQIAFNVCFTLTQHFWTDESYVRGYTTSSGPYMVMGIAFRRWSERLQVNQYHLSPQGMGFCLETNPILYFSKKLHASVR